jgi:cytochrome c-type biogenesis protein CcmE
MLVALGLVGVSITVTLVVKVFNENIKLFQSPSDVIAKKVPQDRTFRLGGLVLDGSLQRENDGLTVHFKVTDTAQTIPVTFTGILPDLFKEGQGVVAEGKLDSNGTFQAKEVLAKHDENYMSPGVKDALDKAKQQTASTLQ